MIPKDFQEHELWQLLEEIAETVRTLPASIEYEDDEGKRTVRNRITVFISTVEQHGKTPSDYYSTQMLDTMNTQWSTIQRKLENLEDSPALAYEIDQELDKIAGTLASWPNAFTYKGFARDSAIAAIDSAIDKWSGRVEFLEQQIQQKDQQLEAQKISHQEDRDELNQKVEDLYELLKENEALIDKQSEKISALNIEHNETFQSSQDKRVAIFDKQVEDLNAKISEFQAEQKEIFNGWFKEQKTLHSTETQKYISALELQKETGASQLREIEELHENVEKAAHGATAAVLARDYNTASLRDFIVGIAFMLLGIILLACAGGALYASFAGVTPDTNITWQWTAIKISITLLITAGATFAFKFSQNFLANASRFKRADLELRAINPFLANIEQTDLADQTKIDFINRSFGQSEISSTNEKKEETDRNNEARISPQEMLETVITAFKNNNS
ncbi:hypothetical protein A7979_05525 [Rothia nasimurium]|uniref:Uncharacterized protein n=1 Tax=Rothia nasimurium TaxID=85336 RepID=A0A1Y1RP65_9MICC|nr:hypothetical protein [Rothia nasimurium]ORC16067.1 hypothetical protein A7979_05525 [Rothia nasimurium]